MSRIESLTGMLAQDPGNSRFRYMLAMEHVNAGQLDAAMTQFEEILARDATYSSAYYQGGQTLEKLGRPDDARGYYRRGIDAATQSGDLHARSELQDALSLLG
ncbi:MAG: tetratricopeptide repeat protein [Bryobacterales bacterium]|nr:tetratricopeptide repeat protein [Bryobacterales bacterium]